MKAFLAQLGEFRTLLWAAIRCAFVFRMSTNEQVERATRRYFTLASLAIGVVLSTWAWTLDNAIYAAALEQVLAQGAASGADLRLARHWALAFFVFDTVLFILTYVGFAIVTTRLLGSVLNKDLQISGGSSPVISVLYADWLVRVARILLVGLVVTDLAENFTAIAILYKEGTENLLLAQLFTVASAAKKIFLFSLSGWLLIAVLVWLLSGAIPAGDNKELILARRHRRAVREAISDVLGRTRYCLLIVMAYGVLMLGIDQAQDVLGGMASVYKHGRFNYWLVAAVLIGLFALHMHAHSVWVWVRLLVRLKRPDSPEAENESPGTTFSKWWGRLLGAAPWLVVSILCVRTAGQALQIGDTSAAKLLLLGGAFASLWGVAFILAKEFEGRKRAHTPHYASTLQADDLLRDPSYRFMRLLPRSPVWIPVLAVVCILLLRTIYVLWPSFAASNALAAISFSFALWTCVLNRIAFNALNSRIPWVLGLVIVVAALGAFDITANHGVLAGSDLQRTGHGQASLSMMLLYSVLLAIGVIGAYSLWMWKLLAAPGAENKSKELERGSRRKYLMGSWALVIGWSAIVLFVGSRGQEQKPALNLQLPSRESLQVAITTWLNARRNECAADSQCDQIPLYLAAAEGGGIRAAYWTAQLLSHLSIADPDLQLPRRLFAMSGVSGGSVGLAAWRLCMDVKDMSPPACVAPLGEADLLTPLASAMLFEDTFGLLIPTGQCDLPGCGFVDRASWFERSLERSVNSFARPLPTSAPHLFLNSSWVETGERAIASSVMIEDPTCVEMRHKAVKMGKYDGDWSAKCAPSFPTGRDQLLEIGAGVRASTLAHNSARFPYFNPIGYVKDQGHLADGGYFDNSGTQTLADILNEFSRQLSLPENADLRARVAVTTIMIRNGVRISTDPADSNCAAPRAHEPHKLLVNALGPLITALNATGIGTPNRVAQCNLQRNLTRLATLLPGQASGGGYFDVRLVSKETLYPLGWYLSPSAREGIANAAIDCVDGQKLADALGRDHRIVGDQDASLHPCFEWVPRGVPPPDSPPR